MKIWFVFVITAICWCGLTTSVKVFSQKKTKDRSSIFGVRKSNIKGSLELALNYCTLKSLLQKSSRVSRHCIRRWDSAYRKYCVKPDSHVTRKCKRLKERAAKQREVWTASRVKSKLTCGRKLYDNSHEGCCRNVIFELLSEDCCSGTVYNTAREACCGDHVYSKQQQDCCGGTVYDVRTEACCDAEVHFSDGKHTRVCCGNRSIDATIFFCHRDKVFVKKNRAAYAGVSPGGDLYPNRTEVENLNTSSKPSTISPGILTVIVSSSTITMATLIAVSLFVFGRYIKRFKKPRNNYCRVNINTNSRLGMENPLPISMSCDFATLDLPMDSEYTNIDRTGTELIEEDSSYFLDGDLLEIDGPTDIPTVNKPPISVNRGHSTVNSESQTCEQKQINYRNSMGQPFDAQFEFNKRNRILQLPDSEVTLTLSDADVAEPKLCLASTFRNLCDISNKLKLKSDEAVASPAVEYKFVNASLKDQAVVTMHFVGDQGKLTVLKICSDGGSESPIECVAIRRKEDVHEGSDEDYYEVIGPGKLAIRIRSFSWLVCLTCGEPHDNFHLTGHLYGRLDTDRHIPSRQKATFTFYVADPIHDLPEYRKEMKDKEKSCVFLDMFRLCLPGEIRLENHVQLSLNPYPESGWKHRLLPGTLTNEAVQPGVEDIPISAITGCQKVNHTGLPYSKTWYVDSTNVPSESAQSLQCIMATAHKTDTGANISHKKYYDLRIDLLYDNLRERTETETKDNGHGNNPHMGLQNDNAQRNNGQNGINTEGQVVEARQPVSGGNGRGVLALNNSVGNPRAPIPPADNAQNDDTVRGELPSQFRST